MNSPTITKPVKQLELYTPHRVQRSFHESKARYRVASLGRQSGKSTMCSNELAFRAWENPSTTYWFISPTFEQARIQYRRFVSMFSGCFELLLKKNQSELRVKFINHSSVTFKSGEVFDNLRGETLDGVVIDEVREQPNGLWPLVIRPMLATTRGWAVFVSTPSGHDSFFDLAEMAKASTDGTWEFFHAPSTCNPLFSMPEYEQARREMSDLQFRQEILAEFVNITHGTTYLNHGHHNQREDSPFSSTEQISPHLPIVVGMDFNVGSLRWVLGQTNANIFYFFDEIAIDNTHTQEACRVLLNAIVNAKNEIWLCGDATGSARKTSAAGETDYSIIMQELKAAGHKVTNVTPDSNPPVKDRVNSVNTALRSAANEVRLWYNPKKCPALKRDLERVVWKQGATGAILDQQRDPSLTHATDAMGYVVHRFSDHWRPSPGVTRVIRR